MLLLDLEWLAPVTRLRSDRWLEFYVQCGDGKLTLNRERAANEAADLALFDHQFYLENMHRRDDNKAINNIWGSGYRANSLLKQLRVMQQKLLVWQGSSFTVNENNLKHWSAILSKIDPVWLIAIGYSDKIKQNLLHVDNVSELIDEQCFSAFPKGFSQKKYADNHVHLGGNGNYTPALAEVSLFLRNKPKSIFENSTSTPKLSEFTKYSSGERNINELPVLIKLLFNDLIATLGKDNSKCNKVDWQRPQFWTIPDESIGDLLTTSSKNNNVTKLLNAAINCNRQDSNKMWLLIAIALVHHGDVYASCDLWLYKLSAYITGNNILRSMMISSGVGLTSFVEHFSFKPRQGSDQVIEYGKHSYESDSDKNTLREFKISDQTVTARYLAEFGFDFIEKNQFNNRQFTFHFSRSFKQNYHAQEKGNLQIYDKRYTTKRLELSKSLRRLQKVFTSSSLQKYEYEKLGNSKVQSLNLCALIRGIDVSGNENDFPIEVFAPAIRVLRNSAYQPDNKNFIPQRKLHLSIHAGEDFSHLLTGLRTIDETIEFCDYESSDRVGHALALGVDVKKWASRQQRAYVPLSSHLDNLVWVYNYAIEVTKKASQFTVMLAVFERKISKWSHKLFGEDRSKYILFEAWRLRRNCPEYFDTELNNSSEESVAWLPDFKSKRMNMNAEAIKYWKEYTDNGIKKIKRNTTEKIVSVYFGGDHAPFINDEYSEIVDRFELDFYEALQDYLIEKYSRKGVVIEACPTSNIYIGRFKCYSEHPVYRWYPVDNTLLNAGEKFNRFGIRTGPITVCVNTDDAGLMPSTIENEHRILKEIAISHFNIGNEMAECWIERLRKIGVDIFKSNHIDCRD
ncbi:amidohydrolase family protein [Pseudoalteromonas aliena]|uniref:Adenosine deaminase domain-containing protein n=1 Tax=Pseudoalteromonas aliena SW19 TaxID=1314866 RepID=A0ABR9E4F6_9GAMM|nr:hypothetical protein [Pseudoalteromonas aliena]MBE0361223.1 hypothetical protein [Pseudoalteromonas aliena SW19]